ncbi:MAG TPA: hypothetical protein VD794_06065 [Flavisolibacter sp.]|nr:hypothetical protein [Flavisolibacter sp.]
MNPAELKAAIEAKTMAFEAALESQQHNSELLQLYKELKELKYQLVQAGLNVYSADATE